MNVAILGTGLIVPSFIQSAGSLPEVHIRALWGRNIEKAKVFEKEADYITDDLERVLSDEEVDAVYVALPNSLHFEYAKKALLHGKHVMVEKPFCTSLKQTEELIRLSEERNLLLFEMNMIHYLPTYQFVKENREKLGRIRLINAATSHYSRRYDAFREGKILPSFDPSYAGGALNDLGVYPVHYITGLYGRPGKTLYYANIEKDVDTSGILVLEYEDFKASISLTKDASGPSYLSLQGEEGYAYCRGAVNHCEREDIILRSGERYSLEADKTVPLMTYELREFLRLFIEGDMVSCRKHLKQTLLAESVLEEARKSAGLSY